MLAEKLSEYDNKKGASLAKLLLIRVPFMLLLAVGVATMFSWIVNYTWIIGSVILFMATLVLTVVFKMQYLRITEYTKRWEFRFYQIHPMSAGFRMIAIDKEKLAAVDISPKLGGMRNDLVLTELTPGGEARYPGLSLTLVSKSDQMTIVEKLKKSIL